MKRILPFLLCLAAASPAAAYEVNAGPARVTYLQTKQCVMGQSQAGSLYIKVGSQEHSRTYAPRPEKHCKWVDQARTVELYRSEAAIDR